MIQVRKKIGQGAGKTENRIEAAVSMPRSEIKRLTDADCGCYSVCGGTYEVVYMLSGGCVLSRNGKEAALSEKELALITPAQYFRFVSVTQDGEAVLLSFTAELARFAVSGILPSVFSGDRGDGIFTAAFTEKNELGRLLTSSAKASEAGELAAGAAALYVLHHAVKNELAADPGALADKGVKSDIGRITSQPEDILFFGDEKSAAARMDMSYSYFSRSFKAAMKMSYSEYVNFRRINEAKRLLVTTEKSVKEIAGTLGFSSPSYFVNMFKAETGISPLQFKKAYQKRQYI